MPAGRPSKYSDALADKICEEIVQGKGIVSICESDDMPEPMTVFRWLNTKEDFCYKYTRAKELQAEKMADDILQIADDGSNDTYMTGEDGDEERVNHDHINRSRLRVDTRKWLMSHYAPKKYSDRIQQELSGKNGGPVEITIVHTVKGKEE